MDDANRLQSCWPNTHLNLEEILCSNFINKFGGNFSFCIVQRERVIPLFLEKEKKSV